MTSLSSKHGASINLQKRRSLLCLTSSSSSLHGDSCCRSPSILPSCLSFTATAKTDLAHALVMVECSHNCRTNCSVAKSHPQLPTKGLLLNHLHLEAVTFRSPLFTASLCNIVCKKKIVCGCPPSAVTTAASWQNLKPSSLHLLSHMCSPARLADCSRDEAQLLHLVFVCLFKPVRF